MINHKIKNVSFVKHVTLVVERGLFRLVVSRLSILRTHRTILVACLILVSWPLPLSVCLFSLCVLYELSQLGVVIGVGSFVISVLVHCVVFSEC